jgi:purine nucleosidase
MDLRRGSAQIAAMRLIIDTDTAGDDVFSLMLALRRPGVSVEAITIAHGNVGFEQHAENALATLEPAGAAARSRSIWAPSGRSAARRWTRPMCSGPTA